MSIIILTENSNFYENGLIEVYFTVFGVLKNKNQEREQCPFTNTVAMIAENE